MSSGVEPFLVAHCEFGVGRLPTSSSPIRAGSPPGPRARPTRPRPARRRPPAAPPNPTARRGPCCVHPGARSARPAGLPARRRRPAPRAGPPTPAMRGGLLPAGPCPDHPVPVASRRSFPSPSAMWSWHKGGDRLYPDPSRDVARHARNIGGDVRITAVQSTSLKKSVRCVVEQPARWGRRRRIQRHDQGSFGQARCPAEVRREPNQPGVGRELHEQRGRPIDLTPKGLELVGTFCWAAGSLSYCCRVSGEHPDRPRWRGGPPGRQQQLGHRPAGWASWAARQRAVRTASSANRSSSIRVKLKHDLPCMRLRRAGLRSASSPGSR